MVRRHPHVFGGAKLNTSQEVLVRWEEIKSRERGEKTENHLGEIPRWLPALMQAYKIQDRASKLGFDWGDVEGPIEKIKEEISELVSAYNLKRGRDIEAEIGDILFSVVNLSRKLSIDPEIALCGCVHKFFNRFRLMEKMANEKGLDFSKLNLEEMDALWEESKKEEYPSE
jgi:tetrapyrrole methylase family protein/MazG family protein